MICFTSPVIEAPGVLPGAALAIVAVVPSNSKKMLVMLVSILDDAFSKALRSSLCLWLEHHLDEYE